MISTHQWYGFVENDLCYQTWKTEKPGWVYTGKSWVFQTVVTIHSCGKPREVHKDEGVAIFGALERKRK